MARQSFLKGFARQAVREETVHEFTPRSFLGGFVRVPEGEKRYRDATWHAAAVALDTDAVRLICARDRDGVYYLAAPAGEFANHPDAASVLGTALPGMPGHEGDGVYCCDLGGNVVASVRKAAQVLETYIGERRDAERFAGGGSVFWPQTPARWVGHREMQSRASQAVIHRVAIVAGVLSVVLLAVGGVARYGTARIGQDVNRIRESLLLQQQTTAEQLRKLPPNPFLEYRRIGNEVVVREGTLRRFDANGGEVSYAAELPAWVSDLGALAEARRETLPGGAGILLTRGGKAR